MRKRTIRWGGILLAGGAAVVGLLSVSRETVTAPPPVAKQSEEFYQKAFTRTTDPLVVFQKAFWRRADPRDLILHAERREWGTATTGIKRWQWFIAVKPGPALRDWLGGNPFLLADTKSPADLDAPPAWFPKPSKEFIIQQKPEGGLTLIWSADLQSLYACDSGGGFAPAEDLR